MVWDAFILSLNDHPISLRSKRSNTTSQIKKPNPYTEYRSDQRHTLSQAHFDKFTIQQIRSNLIVVKGVRRHFESSRTFAAQSHFLSYDMRQWFSRQVFRTSKSFVGRGLPLRSLATKYASPIFSSNSIRLRCPSGSLSRG
jgi:hypothetical protein